MIVIPPVSLAAPTHCRGSCGRICECHNHNYCININGTPKREIFPAEGIPEGSTERGLWPANRRSDGFAFLAQRSTTGGRLGYHSSIPGGCYARAVMANEPDFRNQMGRLEEELKSRGQLVIFYPKFHCELNFTERYLVWV